MARIPSRKAETGMRWLALGVIALTAQFIIVRGLGPHGAGSPTFSALLVSAHLILVPLLVRNLSFWGIRIMLAGLALNLFVMVANGGLMPVEASSVEAVTGADSTSFSPGHISGTKNRLVRGGDIRAKALADVIVLPVPRPFTRAVSAGDALVALGAVVAYGEVIRRTLCERRNEPLQPETTP